MVLLRHLWNRHDAPAVTVSQLDQGFEPVFAALAELHTIDYGRDTVCLAPHARVDGLVASYMLLNALTASSSCYKMVGVREGGPPAPDPGAPGVVHLRRL